MARAKSRSISRSRSRSYSPRPRARSPSRDRRIYDDNRHRERMSSRDQESSGLLVRNLPLDARPNDLRDSFERFGPLRDIYLPKNFYTGEPRGFGFVKYRFAEDAAEAMKRMNHKIIGGREITIVYAEENRKTPREMRTTRVSSGRYGDYKRTSRRSPRRRNRSYSRSLSPARREPSTLHELLRLSSCVMCVWLIHALTGDSQRRKKVREDDSYSPRRSRSISRSPLPRRERKQRSISVSRSPRRDSRSPREERSPTPLPRKESRKKSMSVSPSPVKDTRSLREERALTPLPPKQRRQRSKSVTRSPRRNSRSPREERSLTPLPRKERKQSSNNVSRSRSPKRDSRSPREERSLTPLPRKERKQRSNSVSRSPRRDSRSPREERALTPTRSQSLSRSHSRSISR